MSNARILFFKSFVAAHTRRLKNGKAIQIAAHYDKRIRKGVDLAPEPGPSIEHLDADKQGLFRRMHREQHLLHHYHGHALRKRVAHLEKQAEEAKRASKDHAEAGRRIESTREANRALRLGGQMHRLRRELADVDSRVAGIGHMKERLVAGSGAVQDSTDEAHDAYAAKLGRRWKAQAAPKPPEPPAPTKPVIHRAPKPAPVADETGGVDLSKAHFKERDTLTITKVGRKYLYGTRPGKGYEQKIVLNSVSKHWSVGATVTAPVYTLVTYGRYGTTSVSVPATPEMLAPKTARPDYNEILGSGQYGPFRVALHGDHYRVSFDYDQDHVDAIKPIAEGRSGVSKYDSVTRSWTVPIENTGKLKLILDAAVEKQQSIAEKAAAQKAESAAQSRKIEPGQYGPFLVASTPEGYQVSFAYNLTQVEIMRSVPGARFNRPDRSWLVPLASEDRLDKELNRAKDQAAKDEARTTAAQEQKEQKQQDDQAAGRIRFIEGAKGARWRAKPGSLIVRNGQIYRVEHSSAEYIGQEDAMSFGLGIDDTHRIRYTVVPAVGDDADEMRGQMAAREYAQQTRKVIAQEVRSLISRMETTGVRPEGRDNTPRGETYLDASTAYGGGDWWVIGPDHIWYVKNNGADGDDWRYNNVRTGGAGAIGWRIPYDQQIADKIRGLHEQWMQVKGK